MNKFEVIGLDDTDVLNGIMVESFDRLPKTPLANPIDQNKVSTPRLLVEQSLCGELSEIAVKVAQGLGIFAGREIHLDHVVTVFTPPEPEPQETDLIMCLTWGQFVDTDRVTHSIDVVGLDSTYPGYFGPRCGVLDLVESDKYEQYYGSSGVGCIQTAYANFNTSSYWVTSTVADVASGTNLMGEISQGKYNDFKTESLRRPFLDLGLLV